MNLDAIIMEIQTVRDALAPILADSSRPVLAAALAQLQTQRDEAAKLPKKAKRPPWRLAISPSQPLAFRSTEGESQVKHRLEVDLACALSEPSADGLPHEEHNIAVRVWSTDTSLCFREDVDAETLRSKITAQGRRVMLRFHFDLANKDQQGPRHHLQIGGKAMPADFHWLPDNWKLPRFVHVPVNLALACEFIARTFYPKQFAKLSQEPTWIHAVKAAEETYLFPFLRLLPYVDIDPKRRKASLLSSVWNG